MPCSAVRADATRLAQREDLPVPQRLAAGELSRRCSETILSRGWGDAPRHEQTLPDGLVINVVHVAAEPPAGMAYRGV